MAKLSVNKSLTGGPRGASPPQYELEHAPGDLPKGGRNRAVPLIGFCRNTAFLCEKVWKPNSP